MNYDRATPNHTLLALAAATLWLIRCSTDASGISSDAAPPDAPDDGTFADAHPDILTDSVALDSDAPPDPPIPCHDLKAAWQDFVQAHRTCAVDSDCALVGGTFNYCSCGIAIGDPGGDPISKSAVPKAQPYLDAFDLCRAAGFDFGCWYDHGPAKDLGCYSGTCAAMPQYCGPGDAG